MSPDFAKMQQIFATAVEGHRQESWGAYLDQACANDPEMRRQVELLLKAHREAGSVPGAAARDHNQTASYQIPAEDVGMTIGPYKLIEPIGEGGMGSVWMAQQQVPVKRVVALKFIKAGMDSKQVIARFEAERQALALMDHANIARVLDAGATAAGRPYFVMDLVKGMPITRYCDEHHLTPRQRLELFVPVCQAIQHAHQKGVIHRDLKPSNVLVALYDGKPVPKVIDFGVAKAAGQSLTDKTLVTGFGAIVGTLEYMSPEQAEVNQLDIDTRSDIYSLGVLLYELLAGSPPFSRKELEKAGMLEMLRVIREQEPSKPSTKLSSSDALPTLSANRGTEPAKLTRLVRGELDWIVMKALEKDRSRRYETANGFAMDVQRYLADETVEACPPSAGYRLKKFVHRNKAAALAAAAVLLTLLVGIAGTTFGLFRAEERRKEAEKAQAEESIQRQRVTEEQSRTQAALVQSQTSEAKAVEAERTALRQAADSGCDVAQQLCERNSVAQGLIEYGRALKFAHQAKDADLEDAIRWNIGAWSIQMHALAYTIRTPSASFCSTAAFHPDGKLLAVGSTLPKSAGVVVRLHDVADGSPRNEALTIAGAPRVYRLAWQPNGAILGIYTGDGWVHLWKVGQLKPTISFPVDVGGKYFDTVTFPQVAFSPDGTRLIAGTSQATPTIFDTATGKPAAVQLAGGNRDGEQWAVAVDWSRDGTRILTGNSTGFIQIWNAQTGKLIRATHTSQRAIRAARFSQDGEFFVSASGFGMPELRVWRSQTGAPVCPPMTHYENPYDAELSPDGKIVAVVDSSCEAFLWDARSGRSFGAPIWTGEHSTVATFHPDGRSLLTITWQKVRVWTIGSDMRRSDVSLADPEIVRLAPFYEKYHLTDPAVGSQERIIFRNLALSPDGASLIKYNFLDEGGGFEMIDAKSFQSIRTLQDRDRAVAVYWKPDSREFITSIHHMIKIRDATTGVTKASVAQVEASSCSYRPDGARVALATRDYNVRFFDTTSWKAVGPALPHTSRVYDTAYSRDGKILFTADGNSTRLWHPSTGKRIGPVLPGYSPRACADGESFVIRIKDRSQAYRLPAPRLGEVTDVIRGIEALTGQHGVVVPEDDLGTPIGPDKALVSLGQTVYLEMTIASAGIGGKNDWLFLNSDVSRESPNNFTVMVKNPTTERQQKLGLGSDIRALVGRRIRVRGTVVSHNQASGIIVDDAAQLTLLPTNIAIGPDQARASVGQSIILEMTVRSVGLNAAGEWMYLNSEEDYKNSNNFAIAIKYPTAERRKAMGLDRESEDIVNRRVRVTGKVTLYRDAPQITVHQPEQLHLLPRNPNDDKK